MGRWRAGTAVKMSDKPTCEIVVRRVRSESLLSWLFGWLGGMRWEALAQETRQRATIAGGGEVMMPVQGTHAFSNTRRGAVRKARRRLRKHQNPPQWEVAE